MLAEYQYTRTGLQSEVRYGNGNRVRKEETFGEPELKARMQNLAQVGMQNPVQTALNHVGQNLQTLTEVTCYQYDSLNQLVAENRNNHHISYKYDAVGNRIMRENNGIAERYSYNNRNQLVEKQAKQELLGMAMM